MGAKYLSGLFSAVFGMATAAGAGAQTIEIGVGPAGSIVVKNSGSADSGVSVDFSATHNTWSAQAEDPASGGNLGSTSITLSENFSGELVVWVTETGISLGTPGQLSFSSLFTTNGVPPGAGITETTYFDPSDTAFGTAQQLATAKFSSIGTSSPGATVVDAPTPYSITEEYDVTIPFSPSTGPQFLSTIQLTSSLDGPIPIVPEPSTWTLMAMGFAGLGYAAYRRNPKLRARASIV
jgi:hypothetical protein